MSIHPAKPDGGISAVLRSVAFSSAVFSRADLQAPWAVSTKGIAGGIFHAVVNGHAVVEVEGSAHSLGPGDAIFLPTGAPHVIRHQHGAKGRPTPIGDLPVVKDGAVQVVVANGGGVQTELLCATFSLGTSGVHPLFGGLGPVWVLRAADDAGVLDIVRFLAREVSSHARVGPPLAERLAEALVLMALRRAADSPSTTGWLRGLSDPPIASALSLMHDSPEVEWDVASLARSVGLSRSAFCARFKAATDLTPAAYLAQWRMHLAHALLRAGATVSEVTAQTAYSSEAAFSKAFKRIVGQSPGGIRRQPELAD